MLVTTFFHVKIINKIVYIDFIKVQQSKFLNTNLKLKYALDSDLK